VGGGWLGGGMTASQLGTVVGRGAGVAESNVQSTS
jgi:hypothetical protein